MNKYLSSSYSQACSIKNCNKDFSVECFECCGLMCDNHTLRRKYIYNLIIKNGFEKQDVPCILQKDAKGYCLKCWKLHIIDKIDSFKDAIKNPEAYKFYSECNIIKRGPIRLLCLAFLLRRKTFPRIRAKYHAKRVLIKINKRLYLPGTQCVEKLECRFNTVRKMNK